MPVFFMYMKPPGYIYMYNERDKECAQYET